MQLASTPAQRHCEPRALARAPAASAPGAPEAAAAEASGTPAPGVRDDHLGVLLRRSRGAAPGHRMLQRVGETKAGFTAAATPPAGTLEALVAAFEEIRARRKLKKDTHQAKLANPAATTSERKTLMQEYAKTIKLDDWAVELAATAAFRAPDGPLVLNAERTAVLERKTNAPVATLTRGADMFKETPNPAGGDRKTYLKTTPSPDSKDRIYVDDDRTVKTRRLAFVEKSIYQFMHFAGTGTMTGRFQLLHATMGSTPDVQSGRRQVMRLFRKEPHERLSLEQLAVLHQYKGSGLEQRGVSLTSTPREAVYSNEGTAFSSDDGVRMTVDLAKIPETVKLVNHYSAGGVKDKIREVDGYEYHASVVKNREVYVEKLDPTWIVGASARKLDVMRAVTGLTGAALVTRMTELLAREEYLTGYRAAIDPPSTPSASTSWAHAAGLKGGQYYVNGYSAGDAYRKSLTVKPSTEEIWAAMQVAYGPLAKKRLPDDYWLGWVDGALEKPRGGHLPKKT